MERNKDSIIGKRIRELRLKNHLTLHQLSQATGISSSAIANYEYGFREPNSKAMVALGRFFGVSGEYLLGETESFLKVPPEDTWADPEIVKIILEGFPFQFENLLQNLAGCSSGEQKMVSDILMELRHITGLGRLSPSIRESSIEILRRTVCATSQYLDSCISTSTKSTSNSDRLKQYRDSYLYDIQIALEQAEEVIVSPASK